MAVESCPTKQRRTRRKTGPSRARGGLRRSRSDGGRLNEPLPKRARRPQEASRKRLAREADAGSDEEGGSGAEGGETVASQTCGGGHPLRFRISAPAAHAETLTCDVCGSSILAAAVRYSCDQCDFDACGVCGSGREKGGEGAHATRWGRRKSARSTH